MRKLLLATVAVLGASIGAATVADAQTASPAPGTITVRLNGRFRFYALADSLTAADNNASGTATGSASVLTGQGTATGTNKLTNYEFNEYARLYPGFDGVAANGLKYGASLEIRQDNISGAGGGTFGSISQSSRDRGELYFRREWGYIGTDQLGTIRVGSTDGPSSLYITGNFENFDGGGLNGDLNFFLPGQLIVTWPFGDVGNMYTTNKAIYLSPQFYGFDIGASFEPSTANFGTDGGSGGCGNSSFIGANFVNQAGAFTAATGANSTGVAGPGCDQLSSTAVNGESARRKNTVDALLRYRGTFYGFGIAATGGVIVGSNVKDNSGIAFNNNPNAAIAVRPNYDGLAVFDSGVALTYAGFSVGGKYMIGRVNNQWGLDPKGLPSGEAWLIGASYTIGPIVMGAHYLNYKTAGDTSNAFFGREREDRGVAAGATYSLAPGLSLFLSGIWEERKQNGFNFITGQNTGTATATQTAAGVGNPFNNRVTARVISIGTSFSW